MTQQHTPVPAVVATTPPPEPLVEQPAPPPVRSTSVPAPLPNQMALPAPKGTLALPGPEIKWVSKKGGKWEFAFKSGTVYETTDAQEAQMLCEQYFPVMARHNK